MQRVRTFAGHVTAEPTSGNARFTVVDKETGKTYHVASADGKLSLDVSKQASEEKKDFTGSPMLSGRVQFIGAPFAEGQNLRGCELAPLAVREAGFKKMVERLGWEFLDDGDLAIPAGMVGPNSGLSPEWQKKTWGNYQKWVRSGTRESYSTWSGTTIRSEDDVHDLKKAEGDPYECVENCEVIGKACELVHDAVYAAASKGDFPLTIGGDHSIGSATLAAAVKAYPDLAVIWVDAHADANTPETSPSLHYHGMPAAHAMGWFKKMVRGFEWLKTHVPESRLAYVGLRDIDAEEGELLFNSGAHIFTMQDVDRHGIAQVMNMALSKIDPYNQRPLYLTLDIDGIDPGAAPGTGTLARGGLSYREVHYICEEMSASNRLVGADVVEVNPLVDALSEKMHGDDPDSGPASCTVQLCCELALSALGKTIIQRPKQTTAH